MSKNLIIENTEARLIELPRALIGDKDPDYGYETRLPPGENNVPGAVWAKLLKTSQTIRSYVHLGYLVDKGEGEAKPLTDGLRNVNVTEAKKQIAKCDNVKILKTWGDKDERKTVKAAISSKIASLIQAVPGEVE